MGGTNIILGADHRGFELKEKIKEKLVSHGYNFLDLGAYEYNPLDDYPDIAFKVAEETAKNKNNRGILFCGSGIGVCIAANKVKGVRAGLGEEIEIVKKAREDDDINVLCIPADFVDENKAFALIEVFLNTPFKNQEKYIRRIQKIEEYENQN